MPAGELVRSIRSIARRPGISLSLVATMALGIGATTAVFSVIDATLLKGVPFAKPAELVELWSLEPGRFSHPRLDVPRTQAWLDQPSLFARVEKFADKAVLATGGAEPKDVRATVVSAGLLPMLGVAPAIGRGYTADDAAADAPNVAIVSDDFYRQYLNSPPLDQRPVVRLEDRPYTVIGVMPASFRYPRGIVSVWLPLRASDVFKPSDFNYVARLRAGLSHAVTQQRFDALALRLAAATPRKEGWGVTPMFLDEPRVNKDVRVALWVLAGAVFLVLLVACVNTANLLLVQATARQHELAIRGALGASRRRLVHQLLVEAAVLAVPAVAIGIGVAYWAVHAIVGIMPKELSLFGTNAVSVDARVLSFSVAAGIATWLLCGVGPALHASRANVRMASGPRTSTEGRTMRRVRNALVVAELALSLVLLAGAGLFMRSLSNLLAVDPGFGAAHVLIADFHLPEFRYPGMEQRLALFDDVARAIRGVPGVRDVSFSGGLPPQSGITFGSRLQAEGSDTPALTGDVVIPFADVDTNFIATLGVTLSRGRAINAGDIASKEHVAVVDDRLARKLWPTTDPIGKRFRLSDDDDWTMVVGVMRPLKLMGADDRLNPFSMLVPRRPSARNTRYASMAVRTIGDPAASIAAVKQAIRGVSPLIPIGTVGAAGPEFAAANAKPRFVLVLMSVFAGLALVLAIVGVYGVLSFSVAQRTREIGIRMALGARAEDIVRTMIGEGARLAAAGTLLGLGGAALTTRLAASLLFGVAPMDIGVLGGVTLTLVLAALAGALAPARRAGKADPADVLRSE